MTWEWDWGYFSQLYDREEELEELQRELEESKERELEESKEREERREGEEGGREAEVEQLRATLSLEGVERETMEIKLTGQEELIAGLRLEVRKHQTLEPVR